MDHSEGLLAAKPGIRVPLVMPKDEEPDSPLIFLVEKVILIGISFSAPRASFPPEVGVGGRALLLNGAYA